ncbi:MAG TPA: NAD(P)H-hydrate dehydratase [Terriglobales bacterium]|nr:NAD(P)H-hydrate dehydratase [Terriglobales bacterium]
MKITSTEEMRAIDRVTSERFGVASLTLMENAGATVARVAMNEFPQAAQFLIVCGKGNNGGDGFVAARRLKEAGKEVGVVLLAKREEVRGDAAVMFERMALPFTSVTLQEEFRNELPPALARADVIIDAILGTGFRPPVTGLYADAIEAINAAAAPVVSVDIPSGADSDSLSPQTQGAIARSNVIVTFTAPRPAHVFGILTCGKTVCAPIGSPEEAIVSELGLNLITPREIAELFAPRKPDGHKGLYGHVLVVGGSVGKAGAAAMSGISALRAGAGLVTVATAKSALPMVAGFAFEVMTEPLEETEMGTIALSSLEYGKLDAIADGKDVIAFGPGISRNEDTVQFVRAAVGRYAAPMVIDADGLNAFEGAVDLLNGSERPLVLTPHPGEMARLTGLSTKQVQSDRVGVARQFAREHNCIVVLKGNRSVVALPDGKVWVNPTGNPGMASGGTGDVLTGIVSGLIAQNLKDISRAVIAAVYLHGLAGDIAREKMGEQSLIAGDLITFLPDAIRRLRAAADSQVVEF